MLEPKLLAGVPVALLRGPASSPAVGTILIGALITANQLLDAVAADTSTVGPAERCLEILLVVAFSAVSVRVGLVGLIEERNAVLAHSIRRACLRPPAACDASGEREAVIAVLGLAHLNGVKRLLVEEPPS